MEIIKTEIEDKGRELVCLMKFGSHLYGTNNEASDEDSKGIFVPSKEEILLNRIPKSLTFNTKSKGKEKILLQN